MFACSRNGLIRISGVLALLLLVGLVVPATQAAVLPLSGTMPPFGDVQSYRVSPDGRYAVYVADQQTDEAFELYSVPLAGGAAAVKLNSPLVAGGDVFFSFAISPDSQRVVYQADQQTDGVNELYSVPLAGGAAAVTLNSPLVAGGNVFDFRISPDSQRVVYQADQQTDEVIELFAADIDPRAVGFSAATAQVSEGAGTATLTVALNATVATTVTVPYAVSGGSASNGSDYTLAAGALTIPAGSLTGTITVALIDDALVEGDETVVVTLGTPQNADLGVTSSFTLTTADNDASRQTVGFSAATAQVSEGAGTATLAVALNATAATTVTVPYAVSGGSASNGSDYTLPAGTLTIPAGSLTGTITVALVDDALVEADETVVVTLGTPQNADLAASSSFTLTIADNDTWLVYLPLVRR